MSTEIVSRQSADLAVANTNNTIAMVQHVMDQVMKKGTHYGTIPGCGPKPTLLKPGADALCLAFGLRQTFEVQMREYDGGHREYSVTCRLLTGSGELAGEGVGSCSTMEKKYATRDKKPNPYLADTYNTVLKMAKKRAAVDAVITTTACSDMFTQDIEDFRDVAQPQPKEQAGPQRNAGQDKQDGLGGLRDALKAVTGARLATMDEATSWLLEEFGCEPREMAAAQVEEAVRILHDTVEVGSWPPVIVTIVESTEGTGDLAEADIDF